MTVLGAARPSSSSVIRDERGLAILEGPFATRSLALSRGCRPGLLPAAVVTLGLERGWWNALWLKWAGCSYQGCCLTACEGITPWAPLLPLPPARPALAERKGIGLVSLLPRPQRAGLFVGMYLNCPGNSDTFSQEMFFLNILHWSCLEVGDCIRDSELVLCSQSFRAASLLGLASLLAPPETYMLRGC